LIPFRSCQVVKMADELNQRLADGAQCTLTPL
jgi:hypothetical protein